MAAYTPPQIGYCSNCGASLDPDALVCPECHKYTHSAEMEELAARARSLANAGQLQQARQHWEAVLRLLPANTYERRAVQREIDRLDARLNPKQASRWTKRLGPVGVLIAALVKYKGLLLVLLTKGKFLLSLFLFLGAYWAMFGWWFALGLTGSIFLHEMGHYVMVKRLGFKAELPMFLPGFGAYVKWNGVNVSPEIRAQVSLAGPFFGLLSGILAYGVYLSTGWPVWLAIAHFAGWINLLNLIPVFIFDGAPAMHALDRQGRWAVLLVSVAMFLVLGEFLFLFVAVATAFRIYQRDYPPQSRNRLALAFVALIVANGFLSWFAMNQARLAFPDRNIRISRGLFTSAVAHRGPQSPYALVTLTSP